MNQEQLDMISKFQCPGCSCGTHPADECSSFKPIEENMFDDVKHPYFHCEAHVPGTTIIPGGRVYLGLPRGFDKVGLKVRFNYQKVHWMSVNLLMK